MAFLTRALIATILKSVLEENSVKMGKGGGRNLQSLREHKIQRHLQKTYRNLVISELYILNPWNGCQP